MSNPRDPQGEKMVLNVLETVPQGFLFIPFARIQILLQTQDLIPTFKNSKPLSGFLSGFYRTLKKENIFYFFRGLHPYMLLGISNMTLQYKVISDVKAMQKPREDGIMKYLLFEPDLLTSVAIMAWNAVFHPFEVLQARASCYNFGSKKLEFPSISNIRKEIRNNEGRSAFYKGYWPMTLFMILRQDVFDPLELNYQPTNRNLAMRILRDLTLYPLVVISRRMMINSVSLTSGYQSVMECCKQTFERFGVRGFYRGFQVNLLLYSAQIYMTYKHHYPSLDPNLEAKHEANFI